MRKVLIIACCFIQQLGFAQTSYEKAWQALNENKWPQALELLREAEKDPASFEDAYISRMYLMSYQGKEEEVTDFSSSFYRKASNPYPYIYALWFNGGVAGPYGKKHVDAQLDFLNQLSQDNKAIGTLVSASNYQLGMHYQFSNKIKKAREYFEKVGSIRNWQYTGPFENLSQSGFYKDYGPYAHPEAGAVFKSLTGADVKWFTPAKESDDGWIPPSYNFNQSTAVVYAQNFVNSPTDQTVYCALGAGGSVKMWINDELVISEVQERSTEMDTYIAKCDLKKGTNRVLVQLGFTKNGYPNFMLRFTDEKLFAIPGIVGSSAYAPYPSMKNNTHEHPVIPLFAEEYFRNKIAEHPKNLVNYILLADAYLRNKKVKEARNIMDEAIELAPNNCLLKMEMIEALLKEQNRTKLLEEVEKIKQLDPESLMVLEMNIKEDLENQKYADAEAELNKRISLYGEDENTADHTIALLSAQKKYEELVKEIESLYKKYPDNSQVVYLMYMVKKEVNKSNKEAMAVYDNYMKNTYNYDAYTKYANILSDQGDTDKALGIWRKLADDFAYSPNEYYNLSKYYYGAKQYERAEDCIKKSIALSPYNETFWEQLGDIKSEEKNTAAALEAYNLSLKYDPNQYDIINKIRKLNGKEEGFKLLPQVDIDAVIKADKQSEAKNTDYGYYFILDQRDVLMYPDGATETYSTAIIRITNEKGVDKYKESSIGYGNSQSLLIEKAQVIKKNNVKIEGEKNDNEIVFTNLEAGDVIVFKYRLRNYVYGRFANEFWENYYFCGQIYTATTHYSLTVPASRPIYYLVNNSNLQPAIKQVEDFKQYTWEVVKAEPEKDEQLMPDLIDVGAVLHVSTIPGWKEIANWYSDISNTKAEEDVELIALYKKLFPDEKTKKLSQFQKARIIYDYIESNIRYSSVSFRQSMYVPQRPSLTLTTRLGDCKDLSSLFVTLAKMAGITAQMVLVDTRDNGQKHIILPSVEFNHCIAKAELDNKKYYIELTDNYLPFCSMPNDLNGAAILEIPLKSGNDEKADLKLLQPENRTRDVIKRVMTITPNGSDINVTLKTVDYGRPSAGIRSTYSNLDEEKQLKEIQTAAARGYKNNLKVSSVKFIGLDQLNDSVEYNYSYKVNNEISEIGSLKTFRVVYPDVIASLDNFSSDTRSYPVNYWNYEDIDNYETVVNIQAPAGTKFVELPTSEQFSYRGMKFSIQYVSKAPDKLTITRKFVSDRMNVPASDYAAFKGFFEKIVKAEQKFIAYK